MNKSVKANTEKIVNQPSDTDGSWGSVGKAPVVSITFVSVGSESNMIAAARVAFSKCERIKFRRSKVHIK